jgi:hypothetical protein
MKPEHDWFIRSRRSLEERRQALKGKPVTRNARDLLGLARRGIPIDNLSDAQDVRLIELMELMEANEQGAARDLHGYLADALRQNELTDLMRGVLADMHNALSRGVSADESMLVKPPRGRAKNSRRDDNIRRYILSRLALDHLGVSGLDPKIVYREAARIFGVSQKTLKNICANK